MKNHFRGLLCSSLLALALAGCASSDAYGPISSARLQTDFPRFQAQSLSAAEAQALREKWAQHSQLSAKVFFATWCHDSEREIPRLLGLLNSAKVELIALDHHKHDPDNQVQRFAIARTPTIIVLQAEQELGRITERPQQSLAQDLLAILARAR